ncbi:MAG: transposase [Myxococcota bacterium]|jgi:transposase
MPKHYKPVFKAEVVRLILDEKRSDAQVSSALGVSETSISRWVQQARIDRGGGLNGALTTEEKAELRRLRKEVKTLKMEREILKKATTFFAKEIL